VPARRSGCHPGDVTAAVRRRRAYGPGLPLHLLARQAPGPQDVRHQALRPPSQTHPSQPHASPRPLVARFPGPIQAAPAAPVQKIAPSPTAPPACEPPSHLSGNPPWGPADVPPLESHPPGRRPDLQHVEAVTFPPPRSGSRCLSSVIRSSPHLPPSTRRGQPVPLHSPLSTLHSPLSTLHSPLSTLHPPPSTLHPPPSTLHSRPNHNPPRSFNPFTPRESLCVPSCFGYTPALGSSVQDAALIRWFLLF
jgi:hypothetical protein